MVYIGSEQAVRGEESNHLALGCASYDLTRRRGREVEQQVRVLGKIRRSRYCEVVAVKVTWSHACWQRGPGWSHTDWASCGRRCQTGTKTRSSAHRARSTNASAGRNQSVAGHHDPFRPFEILNPPHRRSSSHLRRILLPARSNLFQPHRSNQWPTNFS